MYVVVKGSGKNNFYLMGAFTAHMNERIPFIPSMWFGMCSYRCRVGSRSRQVREDFRRRRQRKRRCGHQH